MTDTVQAQATDPKVLLAKLINMRDGAKAIGSLMEAEAFAAKISELLLRHKLEMSEIDLSNQDKDEPVGKQYMPKTKDRKVYWEIELAEVIARYHFCKLGYYNSGNALLWIGRPSDRDIAIFLFTTLTRQLEEIQEREYRRLYNNDPWTAKGFRASFRRGAIDTISKRFRELRKQAVCTENAIVLVNSADAAVKEYYAELMEGKKSVRAPKYDSANNTYGYTRGQKAGNGVNLAPNVVKANSMKELQ